MIPLRNRLPYRLHNRLQLLNRHHHTRLNQLELRGDIPAQLLPHGHVPVDVPYCVPCLGAFADEVVFAHERVEDLAEVGGEALSCGEEVCCFLKDGGMVGGVEEDEEEEEEEEKEGEVDWIGIEIGRWIDGWMDEGDLIIKS